MDEDEVAKVTIGGHEITLCLRANDSSAIVVEVHTPSRSANIQKRINLNRPQRNKRKLEPEEGRYAHSHKKKAKKEDFPSVPPADCPIFELPPEIMRYIFTLLPVRSMVIASAVCHDWWELLGDDSLWKHLFIRDLGNPPFLTSFSWKEKYRHASVRASHLDLQRHPSHTGQAMWLAGMGLPCPSFLDFARLMDHPDPTFIQLLFMTAIQSHNLDLLRYIFKSAAPGFIQYMFYTAITLKEGMVVDYLVNEEGAQLYYPKEGATHSSLVRAAQSGWVQMVERILPCVPASDHTAQCQEAFGIAIQEGYIEVAKTIFNHSDITLDHEHLVCAIYKGFVTLVDWLLSFRQIVDIINFNGDNYPLLLATQSCPLDTLLPIMRLLLEKGAGPDYIEPDPAMAGSTLLGILKDRYLENRDIALEGIKMLLSFGADVNLQGGSQRFTALHQAIAANDLVLVRLFCSHGADIHIRDAKGMSPLMLAARKNPEVLGAMLETKRSQLNNPNGVFPPGSLDDGWSSLLYCAMSKLPDIATILLDNGADVNTPVGSFKNLLLGLMERHPNGTERLLPIAQLLLARGLDVNEMGKYGTVLHLAAASSSLEMVKLLVEHGAEHRKKSSGRGETPFDVARRLNLAPDIVVYLSSLSS